MIKLNILNLKDFLSTINECSGTVYLLYSDGRKENINKQYQIQSKLWKSYRENKNCLKVSLDIVNPKDYMDIVYYWIRNC